MKVLDLRLADGGAYAERDVAELERFRDAGLADAVVSSAEGGVAIVDG